LSNRSKSGGPGLYEPTSGPPLSECFAIIGSAAKAVPAATTGLRQLSSEARRRRSSRRHRWTRGTGPVSFQLLGKGTHHPAATAQYARSPSVQHTPWCPPPGPVARAVQRTNGCDSEPPSDEPSQSTLMGRAAQQTAGVPILRRDSRHPRQQGAMAQPGHHR